MSTFLIPNLFRKYMGTGKPVITISILGSNPQTEVLFTSFSTKEKKKCKVCMSLQLSSHFVDRSEVDLSC